MSETLLCKDGNAHTNGRAAEIRDPTEVYACEVCGADPLCQECYEDNHGGGCEPDDEA